MKIIVWGVGLGCKYALEVCEALNWDIVAIVDSDLNKIGKEMYKLKIQSPDILKNIVDDEYIMVSNSFPEVLELARKYTERVIDWETVCVMYKGAQKRPDYEVKGLSDKHINNCKLLKDRTELLKHLSSDYSNEKLVFAEIGVAYGDFSKEIMKIVNPAKFILIDAWEGERYKKGLEIIKDIFEDSIAEETVEIHRGYSDTMLEQFNADFFDVVYIDTNHTYETTWRELVLCNEKVREGGMICGHDYTQYNIYSRMNYGVYDAVNRFCVEYNYEICYLTMESDGLHSYALRKIIE